MYAVFGHEGPPKTGGIIGKAFREIAYHQNI